jgi:hypothetical protein
VLAPQPSAVICKYLDHAAFGNPTMGTLCDHVFQFGLQLDEDVDPPFDLTEPGACNYIRRRAGLIRVVLKGEPPGLCGLWGMFRARRKAALARRAVSCSLNSSGSRSMSKPQTRCVFCGELGATKGHIWPKWFNQILPQTATHHEHETGKFSTFKPTFPGPAHAIQVRQGAARSRKPRNTCKICNSGWMSGIENFSISFATPLILNNSPTLIPPFGQRALASLLSLMATRFEFTASARAVSQEDRNWLRLNHEPSHRWKIWIANYGGTQPEQHWARGYAMQLESAPTDEVGPDKCNAYIATLVIGQLCAHLFYSYVTDFGGYEGIQLARIWPPRGFDLNSLSLPSLSDQEVLFLHEAFARDAERMPPRLG